MTPFGNPASAHNIIMYSATMGVDSLGLNTIVLPAINAGVMCPLGKCNGKLKGPITANTPCDSCFSIVCIAPMELS